MDHRVLGLLSVSSVLGTPIYFAHPNSFRECGLSKNTNGLIRKSQKKGDSLKGLTLEQCKRCEDKWNARSGKPPNFASMRNFIAN